MVSSHEVHVTTGTTTAPFSDMMLNLFILRFALSIHEQGTAPSHAHSTRDDGLASPAMCINDRAALHMPPLPNLEQEANPAQVSVQIY